MQSRLSGSVLVLASSNPEDKAHVGTQSQTLAMSLVSYPLYVYVLYRWGHISEVNLWLLGTPSLGSWPAPGRPHSLGGSPQRQQHQDCQHTTPYSSHDGLVQTGLKCCCSNFLLTSFPLPLLLSVCNSTVPYVLYTISHTDSQNCIKRQKSMRQTTGGRGWLGTFNINLVYRQNEAMQQCTAHI